ncbi:YsnF/AvaK domain-containing protein [Salinicoccus sp. ID82-1]|uniref:YsnF/AvaK domain-containing protein n=1 Tax=Salinicoccus sp. ID82-1 TaxID=2820269 RepID=UPI001F3CAD0E|nr:YsnF/AvaK domain-containing protein [Salinicoccus sp. ID82-1]MCG1010741.1 YsnF/AvaK domain-containing protein [Salinicoccus sp. ID82-1]
MRKMETFIDEREVTDRIDQLKSQGVDENDMTLIANRDLNVGGAFGAYSDVNIKSSEGSPWDKVVSFFTGEDTQDQRVNDARLTAEEEESFRQALNENKIVLYVDDEPSDGRNTGVVDNSYGDVTGVSEGATAGTVGAFAATGRDRDTSLTDDSYADAGGVSGVADTRTNDDYAATGRDRNTASDEETMALREERLRFEKENVQTGEVDVDKHVETERQEFDVPVERDEVTVERRPVDDKRPADDSAFIEGEDSIRIPVNEERVNVDKESVVSEEVVIKKDKVKDKAHVSEEVRHEEVDIDETSGKDRDGLRDEDETLSDGFRDNQRRDGRI